MAVTERPYCRDQDFHPVGRFLVRTYGVGTPHRNWVRPRWEYMHFSVIDTEHLDRCRIWEDRGRIVGMVHYESKLGVAYLQLDPAYGALKEDLVAAAEQHLPGQLRTGFGLYIYADDTDDELSAILSERRYERRPEFAEPTSRWPIPDPFPEILLPCGFELATLAEENDLRKIHRVLHRGFNHEGEPPEDGLEARHFGQQAPNFRKDLTVVVRAPDGAFVSYCGVWYEPTPRLAYVEPVATDPDYRRMGLGTAAVREAIRRCADLGAREAHVGSDQNFYWSMGFEVIFRQTPWWKPFDPPQPGPDQDSAESENTLG